MVNQTPDAPNFTPGVGRLATDRYDFQNHVDGYAFRHKANQVDLFPTVVISSNTYTNVQTALQALITAFNSLSINIPDASTTTKGIVQLTGDIAGTATNVIVTRLQGRAVSNLAPTNGQALTWDSGTSTWRPATIGGSGGNIFENLTVTNTATINSLIVNGPVVNLTSTSGGDINLVGADSVNLTSSVNDIILNANRNIELNSQNSLLVNSQFQTIFNTVDSMELNSDRNITLNAARNINLNATRSVNITSTLDMFINGSEDIIIDSVSGTTLSSNSDININPDGNLILNPDGNISVNANMLFNSNAVINSPNELSVSDGASIYLSQSSTAVINCPIQFQNYGGFNHKVLIGGNAATTVNCRLYDMVYVGPTALTANRSYTISEANGVTVGQTIKFANYDSNLLFVRDPGSTLLFTLIGSGGSVGQVGVALRTSSGWIGYEKYDSNVV